jgi:hypothetical protein
MIKYLLLILIICPKAFSQDTIKSLCLDGCQNKITQCCDNAVKRGMIELEDGKLNPDYDPKRNVDKEVIKCRKIGIDCRAICNQKSD